MQVKFNSKMEETKMLLRYLFGPKKGQEVHVPITPEVKTLVAEGIAEVIPPAPKPVAPPRWALHRGVIADVLTLQVVCDACQLRANYCGPATDENFASIEAHSCLHVKQAGGIPKEARDSYRYALEGRDAVTEVGFVAGAVVQAGGSVIQPQPFRLDAEGKRR